jgi:hypothetical protein
MDISSHRVKKEKEEKMKQINTMKTNSKRKKDLRLATWNVRSPGGLRIMINELRKYKIAIAAIQATRWNKFTPQAFTSNGYNIFTSSLANNHETRTQKLAGKPYISQRSKNRFEFIHLVY